MKYKVIFVAISFCFAAVSVVSGYLYQQRQTAVVLSTENSYSKVETDGSNLSNLLVSVFADMNQIFVNPELTTEKLSEIRLKVDKMSDEKEKEQELKRLEEAGTKVFILQSVLKFYEEPVRSDGTINEQAVYRNDYSKTELDTLKKVVEESKDQDAFYQQVWSLLSKETGDLAASADTSDNQAKQLVAEIVQNGKLVSDYFTLEQYQQAYKAVQSLPEGTEKEHLMVDLRVVQKALDNMGIRYDK